jgi:hypothetical protein
MRVVRPIDVVTMKLQTIEPVDCGTCPVTVACAIEEGGAGWLYACCGSIGVYSDIEGVQTMLMVDCGVHKFARNEASDKLPKCPLCSGKAIEIALRHVGTPAVWVPTVHARVPAETRVKVMRDALPEAQARAAAAEERKRRRG